MAEERTATDTSPRPSHMRRVALRRFALERGGNGVDEYPVADAGAGLGEAGDVVHVERVEFGLDAAGEPVVREELAIRLGRRGEAAGNRDA